MTAKFFLVGFVKNIKKIDGDKPFYGFTVTTKSSYEDKEYETNHDVICFTSFLFTKLDKIANNTHCVVEGKIGKRKVGDTWITSLNCSMLETSFANATSSAVTKSDAASKPAESAKTAENSSVISDDDIPF